ncbi:MAG: DUF6049 family protein [Actinomycetota bacterium]|nr:DUF6049 family protein [Actinomycetota bacterium]
MRTIHAAVLVIATMLGWNAALLAPAGAQQDQPLARLELNTLTPRVVTPTGPAVLTVTGEVANTGDRTISDLAVRVQRDEALTNDGDIRAALTTVPNAPFVTEFTGLGPALEPGQRTPFRIEVPLGTGPELQALQITKPGVYPLLVNLNGIPDFGGPARLAAVPLLLPVTGLPETRQPEVRTSAPAAGELSRLPVALPPIPPPVPPPVPVPLTVIWPLAAEPVRMLSEPGQPLLFASPTAGTDPIATQLAPGGRLDGLLGALEEAVPPGAPLAGGLCVAIDPALLETVQDMTGGYLVADPTGLVDGTGAAAAGRWLERLRAAVAGRCVLPLPYGDPDLVALSRAGLTDLEALAASTGTKLVNDLLGVQPLTGMAWPVDGALDERTFTDLTGLDIRAVLLEPSGVARTSPSANTVTPDTDTVRLTGGSRGLLADPLLVTALEPAAPLALPATNGVADPDADDTRADGRGAGYTAGVTRPAGTADPLAAQDGLGALIYRALDEDRRPVLLVPPRHWQVNGTEATMLLQAASQLITAGFLVPRDLPALIEAPAQGPAAELDYPMQAGAQEIPRSVTGKVAQARDVLRDLQVATERDATVSLEPTALLDPLRLALLRGVSTAWRDEPDRALDLVTEVAHRLDELSESVRIATPPGPYTLASSDAPLLLTVKNDLPVSIDVQLGLEETPGLRTDRVGVQQVPARSNRQFVVPAKVTRVGTFSIDARLTTPGGTPLGQPSTLQLRSTAFGTVTVALTAGAGAVLVLLVVRQVARRIRAARAGHAAR